MARIIVAEDDEQISYLIEFRLEEAGHEVVLVQDGRMLLEELAARPADLLVVDVMMPRMDGFAALRELRERGDDTPVIVVSALTRAENRTTADGLGVAAYLPKPFQPDDLVEAIRHTLG